jgi:hypothetical protein
LSIEVVGVFTALAALAATLIALSATAIATVFARCTCFLCFGALVVAVDFVAAFCITAVASVVAIATTAATATATATAFAVAFTTLSALAFFASAVASLANVFGRFRLGFGVAAEQALQPSKETAAAFSFGFGFACLRFDWFGRLSLGQ